MISLAHLSLIELSPEQLIEMAATAGFDAVGLRLTPENARNTALLSALRKQATSTEVEVLDVEVMWLGGGVTTDGADSLLEAAALLGARFVVVNGVENELGRIADRFAELCRRAEPLGVRPVIEFAPTTGIRTLADARRVAESTSGGVLVDVLHLHRSGGAGRDLIALDSERLPYLELCDGPLRPPVGGTGALAKEARQARLPPGRGEFPLGQVLDGCPLESFPISVKAPSASLRAQLGDVAFVCLLRDSAEEVVESYATGAASVAIDDGRETLWPRAPIVSG